MKVCMENSKRLSVGSNQSGGTSPEKLDDCEQTELSGQRAVCVCNSDRTITETDDAFGTLFDAEASEITGSSLAEFLADRTTATAQRLSTRLREDIPLDQRLTVLTGDNRGRTLTVEILPVGSADSRQLVVVCAVDSDRERTVRRAELLTTISSEIGAAETYLSGLETTIEAICTHTEWTYGELWTPAADGESLEFALGYTDDTAATQFLSASRSVTFQFGEGLPGSVYESQSTEWIPDASAEPHNVFHRASLADDAELRAAFGVPIVADGEVVSVLVFLLRQRREVDKRLASDIEAVVSALGGLIKRKQIQDTLRRQHQQLERFSSTVSHDLRNPLNVAQGYLEVAQQDGSDEALQTVQQALDRMDELIENLLTLAKEGSTIGNPETVSVSEIATAGWQQVRTHGATLDSAGGTLHADPIRLQQLFENLFRNAIEHAGADATVRVGQLAATGTPAESTTGFYVEDDGPGIPPADRTAVFDETYSTDSTGIGLTTVKRIATAHGWSVCCTESRDGGARFEFRPDETVDSPDRTRSTNWTTIAGPEMPDGDTLQGESDRDS